VEGVGANVDGGNAFDGGDLVGAVTADDQSKNGLIKVCHKHNQKYGVFTVLKWIHLSS